MSPKKHFAGWQSAFLFEDGKVLYHPAMPVFYFQEHTANISPETGRCCTLRYKYENKLSMRIRNVASNPTV